MGEFMKRVLPYLLLITGICLSVSAVMVVFAQDGGDLLADVPQFAGSRECRDCHRSTANAHADTVHAWTMVEVEADVEVEDNPVVADFSQGDDVRSVTFPGAAQPRSFNLDDIAFTLGAGRNVQAYIYQADDDAYYVLPAEWNVAEETWQPLELAETWPDEAYAFGPNCAGCHTLGLNIEANYQWQEEGVMCEACHGPGLDHVLAADAAGGSINEEELVAITSNINPGLDPQICGQCHVRGIAEDGIHPYATNFIPGVTDLEDVYDPVEPNDDEFFWPTGNARLPNMQYNEWINAAHSNSLIDIQGRVAYKAECLTCHSATQLLIDLRQAYDVDAELIDPLAIAEEHSYGVACVACHDPHMEIDNDTLSRPAAMLRADDSYALCTSCHRSNDIVEGIHYPVADVFEGRSLVEGFETQPSPHFSAEDGPGCMTCHMPIVPTYNGDRVSHTFEIIAPGSVLDLDTLKSSCEGCHDESPAVMQQLIDDLQAGTRERISSARQSMNGNSAQWVSSALDVVENEGSFGIHNYTYTNDLLNHVEQELGIEGASLTTAVVIEQIDAALPDVDTTVPLGQEPLIAVGGLTTPSIVLLVISGLILAATAIILYRSESR